MEVLRHDDIEIDRGVAVFRVIEIEDGGAFADPGADRGYELGEGKLGEAAGADEAVEGDGEGHAAAGDGGGASAAVGLQDIGAPAEENARPPGTIKAGAKRRPWVEST